MAEVLTFHFEGALADAHRMNFYESARFQYAAARLVVKLAQFRRTGRFAKKITNSSNFNIDLVSQADGSFNINVEDPADMDQSDIFVRLRLSDLIAYVAERLIEKIGPSEIESAALPTPLGSVVSSDGEVKLDTLDQLVDSVMDDDLILRTLPVEAQDLVRRRVAESYREQRLFEMQAAVARIDAVRGQKLIAMAAPLMSDMATALRRSANTLEVTSSATERRGSVLFLDRKMAREIETAAVDKEITPVLGDIAQFNKDNGWGKLKIENGTKTLSFNIPSDILPYIRQRLIDHMKRDLVYLQTYFVRDRAGEVVRLTVVGILPTPIN